MAETTPLLGPVVDQLGTDIVSGDMAEGTRFRLGDIEKRFGISRTVAREVARQLAPWSAQIITAPGRGRRR